MELEDVKNQLVKWKDQLRYWSKYNKEGDYIYIDQENGRVEMMLYTNDHSYRISARPPKQRNKNDKGYLGCQGGSRKPRAGEDWTRGNDLPDGFFCHETWVKILGAIVGYELVKIHRPLIYHYHPELEKRYTPDIPNS